MILILERDLDTFDALRRIITRPDQSLRRVGSADQLLATAAGSPPELFLIDLDPKDGDGLDLIRRIRRHKALRHIPVIAVSADGRRGIDLYMEIEDLGEGRLEYIAKPFDPDALHELVGTILVERKKAA